MKWFLVRVMSNRYVQALMSNQTTVELVAFGIAALTR